MNQYEEIDAAILKSIESGKNLFHAISLDVTNVTHPLAEATGAEEWRIVDRRLQSLRKKGKISYSRADGWEIVKEAK
jgi:hypothetical protein